jgi:DNA-binding IclR family transcriptional regulator
LTTALDRPPEEAAEDTSFARGLRVFLTIADRGEIRADELSTLLETPLSTIYRYLRTLTEFGFVERQGSGYRLGSRLHVLGAGPAVSAEELIRAADPVLITLTEATGETAFISRRIGVAAVCLAQVASPQALRVALEPGQAGPLHIGAVGEVLLAFAPSEVQDAALADVPSGSFVHQKLAAVAGEALATDTGDTFLGVTTVAVPIMRADGIVAAICVAAPAERAGRRWLARTRGALRRAASEIEQSLGSPPSD